MTSRPERLEETRELRERLLASLRVGHALGLGFSLGIESGHPPSITLRCATAAEARWAARLFTTGYGRGAWMRESTAATNPVAERLFGRRVRSWPEPLREATDGPSGFDCLAMAMAGLPAGLSVLWKLSPAPVSWSRGPDLPVTLPSGPPLGRWVPSADRTAPIRRPEGWPAARPKPVFWKAEVELGRSPSFPKTLPTHLLRSVVERALRSSCGNGVRFSRVFPRGSRYRPWFAVSETELVLLLPSGDTVISVPEERERADLPLLPLGRSALGRVVGPPVEPGQGRHLAVLGETGMGKSSSLVAIALRAMRLGGVVLFDPLGETADAFLRSLSADERSRVVWIAPRRANCGINALEGIGGDETDRVIGDRRLNDLVHSFRRIRSGRYTDATFWGPRLEEMLTRAVSAAAAFPGGTLVDAHTLLATGGRTRQVIPPSAREAVRELSDRIRDRPDDAEGARRLLYELVRSPVLEAMLCDRTPRLRPKDLVAPGQVVVLDGRASEVGESVARYLLAVYLAIVWSELLERATSAKTFVVLDESQWFSHESLSEMLRLARRRNVHVVLATQSVGSLPDAVSDAVWTNVSDFLAFRGSPEEAREFSRATPAVSMEELLALPRGHAAALLGKGNRVEWVRTVGRASSESVTPVEIDGARMPSDTVVRDADARRDLSDRADTILAWIIDENRHVPAAEFVRVRLSDLRQRMDPGGQALRAAGAKLGRVGALVATERSEAGSVWVVNRAKIPAVSGATGRPTSAGDSEVPQPS